eukprot:c12768_g1_i1.p1 GENE.c12768_g1_i1~~c12768_g1_i1.p1  ORF type:complete len:1025 (-),score=248.76 c12768_g1_i1:720-3794(-)
MRHNSSKANTHKVICAWVLLFLVCAGDAVTVANTIDHFNLLKQKSNSTLGNASGQTNIADGSKDESKKSTTIDNTRDFLEPLLKLASIKLQRSGVHKAAQGHIHEFGEEKEPSASAGDATESGTVEKPDEANSDVQASDKHIPHLLKEVCSVLGPYCNFAGPHAGARALVVITWLIAMGMILPVFNFEDDFRSKYSEERARPQWTPLANAAKARRMFLIVMFFVILGLLMAYDFYKTGQVAIDIQLDGGSKFGRPEKQKKIWKSSERSQFDTLAAGFNRHKKDSVHEIKTEWWKQTRLSSVMWTAIALMYITATMGFGLYNKNSWFQTPGKMKFRIAVWFILAIVILLPPKLVNFYGKATNDIKLSDNEGWNQLRKRLAIDLLIVVIPCFLLLFTFDFTAYSRSWVALIMIPLLTALLGAMCKQHVLAETISLKCSDLEDDIQVFNEMHDISQTGWTDEKNIRSSIEKLPTTCGKARDISCGPSCYVCRVLGNPQAVAAFLFAVFFAIFPLVRSFDMAAFSLQLDPTNTLLLPAKFDFLQNVDVVREIEAVTLVILFTILVFGISYLLAPVPAKKSTDLVQNFLQRVNSDESRLFTNLLMLAQDAITYWNDNRRYSDVEGFATSYLHRNLPAWMHTLVVFMLVLTADLLEVYTSLDSVLHTQLPNFAPHIPIAEIFVGIFWFCGIVLSIVIATRFGADVTCPASYDWAQRNSNCYFFSGPETQTSTGVANTLPLGQTQEFCKTLVDHSSQPVDSDSNLSLLKMSVLEVIPNPVFLSSLPISAREDFAEAAFLASRMEADTPYAARIQEGTSLLAHSRIGCVKATYKNGTSVLSTPHLTEADCHAADRVKFVCLVKKSVFDKDRITVHGSSDSSSSPMFVLMFVLAIALVVPLVVKIKTSQRDSIAVMGVGGVVVLEAMVMMMFAVVLWSGKYNQMPVAEGFTASLLFMLHAVTATMVSMQNIIKQVEPRYVFPEGKHVKGLMVWELVRSWAGLKFGKLSEDKPHFADLKHKQDAGVGGGGGGGV